MNVEHLEQLERGVESWNFWRVGHALIRPNFQYVNLRGAKLGGAFLRDAIFSAADLSGADLGGAVLVEANLNATALREVDLRRASLTNVNGFQANFSDADLRGADLREGNLDQATFMRADLREATLWRASLRAADLRGADLRHANLGRAVLTGANLTGADCRGASFVGADLTAVRCDGADFGEATLAQTRLADLDLSGAKGLESVVHLGPSTAGIDTIYRCGTKLPEGFLQGLGVPDLFLTYMASLVGQAFEFFACAIRCSADDRRFGDRLFADLRAKGVRTWYLPEADQPPDPNRVLVEVDQSLKVFDKVVVVCSASALRNRRILDDVEQALDREAAHGPGVLFPVRVDDFVLNGWSNDRQAAVLERGVADFSGWETSADRYEAALDELLGRLNAAPSGRSAPPAAARS
jgi:uncharacterized protein YjbI with pentapeptide repeats